MRVLKLIKEDYCIHLVIIQEIQLLQVAFFLLPHFAAIPQIV